MRVSQRLDYALRVLVLLAMQPAGKPVAAGELAERLGLPRRFAEQQVSALSRAGIVQSRRGAAGGCALARPAETISVRDVVEAVEGEVLDVPQQTGSAAAEAWADAAAALAVSLSRVDLGTLARRQRVLDAESNPMYYI